MSCKWKRLFRVAGPTLAISTVEAKRKTTGKVRELKNMAIPMYLRYARFFNFSQWFKVYLGTPSQNKIIFYVAVNFWMTFSNKWWTFFFFFFLEMLKIGAFIRKMLNKISVNSCFLYLRSYCRIKNKNSRLKIILEPVS